MKILHLATQDTGRGGGGFDAAFRLHRNMKADGLESCMLVLHKQSDDPDVTGLAHRLPAAGRLRRLVYLIRRRLSRRVLPISPYFHIDCGALFDAGQLQEFFPFRPDVIIAHWVAGFLTPASFRDLSSACRVPILWYLVDMGALTGGCHYAFDCDAYTRQCGQCPQLGFFRGRRDLSFRQWQTRNAAMAQTDLTAVAASTWLRRQVDAARVFHGKRSETILLGIDVDRFCPGDREDARKMLGVPQRAKIIFFGAHQLAEKRKGIQYLVGALRQLYAGLAGDRALRDQIVVVTAGQVKNLDELEILFEQRHLGFLSGDRMLAAGYQAADIYVNASIEDSGPMMINEALLCGTPVVSFAMGVAIDLVHTGRTGYRARLKDEGDMADGLLQLLQMDAAASAEMRENCRQLGLQSCHPGVQVAAFRALCRDVMDAGRKRE